MLTSGTIRRITRFDRCPNEPTGIATLVAMASNLFAMAYNLRAMAANRKYSYVVSITRAPKFSGLDGPPDLSKAKACHWGLASAISHL